MNPIGKAFEVRDGIGRCSGTVVLEWSHDNLLGTVNYSGYLKPNEQFEAVRPIFESFDLVFGDPERTPAELNKLTDEILNLDVTLVYKPRPEVTVRGLVTVNEDLLLTLQARK